MHLRPYGQQGGAQNMADLTSCTPARTALMLVDLQNDFLNPDGAYGRAGQTSDAIASRKSSPKT